MFMVVDWFGWGFWPASAGPLEVRRIFYIQLQEQFQILKSVFFFFFFNAAQIQTYIYLADIQVKSVTHWYLGS